MKRTSAILFALLLLLATGRCLALDAAFVHSHACVRPGPETAWSCDVARHGDTLSGFSHAFYGSGNLYKGIQKASYIKNANRIFLGMKIVIPVRQHRTIAATAYRVQPHADNAMTALAFAKLHITADAMRDDATMTALSLPDATDAALILRSFDPLSGMTVGLDPQETAHVERAEVKPAQNPLTVSSPRNVRPITAYRLVIPKEVAAAERIPLGVPLTTHYYLYSPDTNRACGYMRLNKKSYARQEGDTIALYVPFRKLPTQAWKLDVSGINGLIDGVTFAANAQPYYGRIPEPHHVMRNLYAVVGLGGSGYTLAAVAGPFAGGGIVVGMITTRLIMRHIANAQVEHAEKNYNAVLASQGNMPAKETGQ